MHLNVLFLNVQSDFIAPMLHRKNLRFLETKP